MQMELFLCQGRMHLSRDARDTCKPWLKRIGMLADHVLKSSPNPKLSAYGSLSSSMF